MISSSREALPPSYSFLSFPTTLLFRLACNPLEEEEEERHAIPLPPFFSRPPPQTLPLFFRKDGNGGRGGMLRGIRHIFIRNVAFLQ